MIHTMTKTGSALAVALAFFVSVTSPASGKDILFVNPGYADKGFWHAVSSTMRASAEAFGFDLTIVSADRKWPVMVSKGLEAIEALDPDYVIIVNEQQQAPTLLEATSARDIPTLLLLNDLTNEQKMTYGQPREKFQSWIGSITPDNEIAGYEMARAVIDAQTRRGVSDVRILSLAGDFKTPASLARLDGLDRAVSQNRGFVEEIRRLTVNWSEQEAYERTLRLLDDAVPNAIWAANDPIAFGAMRALKERDLIPGEDVSVSGLNWSLEAIDAVIRGEMELTHGGHFLAGAWSIVLIADYDRGKDFADLGTHVRFPMSAMTPDRAKQYKSALGDQDWSKIRYHAFSRIDNDVDGDYEFTLSNILENLP